MQYQNNFDQTYIISNKSQVDNKKLKLAIEELIIKIITQ